MEAKADSLIGTVLSGADFKKRFADKKFVKLTKRTENHNGFRFTTGLNTDTVAFNPSDECQPGGIYFCELEKIGQWVQYDQTHCVNYRMIEFPDDARVYVEEDKFKADKLILGEKKDIWSDEKICELIVSRNGRMLKYVKEPTEKICELAVSQYGLALQYVKKQTEKICELAVFRSGSALQYVKEQTEKICELAVSQNGLALEYVKEQTEKICELAVKQNSIARMYIRK